MKRATWLAWATWALTIALTTAGLVLLLLARETPIPDRFGFPGYPAILAISFGTVGAIVAASHPRNRIGWILCAAGLISGAQVLVEEYGVFAALTRPGALPAPELMGWISSWIWVPSLLPLLLLFLVFPDGQLLSRRWGLVGRIGLAGTVVGSAGFALLPGPLLNQGYLGPNPFGLESAGVVLTVATAVGGGMQFVSMALAALSLVLRLRRSSGVQRQQLKWFAYAGSFAAAAFFGTFASLAYDANQVQGYRTLTVVSVVAVAAVASLPLAVGVAILRYRLYDIDVLINRTLVYGALSAIVVGTYAGSVILFQALLRPVTSGSELAVAGSTLVVVGLFQPIRQRIQTAVDHRFYRSRYDAALTLDAFAARMRDQVDIDAVRREVLDVVGTSLSPTHASVWLRGAKG